MRFLRPTLLVSFVIGCVFVSCEPNKQSTQNAPPVNQAIPYNLTQPSARYELSSDLREVSGLSYYKHGQLAMIQDELAVVFIYDLGKKQVVGEQVFGDKGDYEGVEWINDRFYALRSDGELYYFEPGPDVKIMGGGGVSMHHIKIDMPGKNDVEGLGYDPKLNALLLATKNAPKEGTDKPIYFYSLDNGTLLRGPVLKQKQLRELAGESKKEANEIKPSGIAVHPKSGLYYLLASAGKRLVILDRNGHLQSSVGLDNKLFRQPEGICFAPDGTLYIASEGDGKKGYVLEFKAITL